MTLRFNTLNKTLFKRSFQISKQKQEQELEQLIKLLLKFLREIPDDIFIEDFPITREGYISLYNLSKLIEVCDNIAFIKFIKYLHKDTIFPIIKRHEEIFSYKEEDSKLLIRANQGHSLVVGNLINFSEVLEIISTPIPGVCYSSYKQYLELIQKEGLKRKKRFHIPITKSLDAESEKRNSTDLIVYINMKKAMADGIKFYKSVNEVILTEGVDGILPPQYLTYALLDNGVLTIIE
jgi:2'-phosphotransferase